MTTVSQANYGTTTMGSGTNAVDCEQFGQDVGSAYEKVTDFAGDAIEAAAPWVALQAGVTAGAVAGALGGAGVGLAVGKHPAFAVVGAIAGGITGAIKAAQESYTTGEFLGGIVGAEVQQFGEDTQPLVASVAEDICEAATSPSNLPI